MHSLSSHSGHVIGGGAGGGAVGIFSCVVAFDIPSSGRETAGGPAIPESTSTPKLHVVPRGSPNMHKGDTYGVPSKYWNGVLPSGRTVNLERTNPT